VTESKDEQSGESSKNSSSKYMKIPIEVKARPYLILAPSLIVTIGILYPFVLAIIYSLTNYSFRSQTYHFIGLQNWVDMFSKREFWHAALVTSEYALASTGSELILGLGIALLLNRDSWYTRVLRVLLIFPLMVAPVIAVLIWQLMTNNAVGILEKLLNLFGLFNFPWASSAKTALFTAVVIDFWVYCPFVIILARAGLQSLPKSPFEAAKIDGGSAWFTFKTITLPMLKPILYIAVIFRLMASLQEFTIIYGLTKGGPGNTLMNLSITAYNTGFAFMRFGKSLPYILFLWLLIYIISQRLVKNWLAVQKAASGY